MKYLDIATKIAKGTLDEPKNSFLAAIGERSDGILVMATNVRTKNQFHGAHCEVRLLKKCDVGSTIYLVRITRDGKWAMSKPCVKCQTLIKNKRVKKVIYTVGPDEYSVWFP